MAENDHATMESDGWAPSVFREQPELVSLRRFRADLGVVSSTCWRWIQKGILGKPINIYGRLYLTREQIAEFKRRAIAGEFAADIKPPRPKRKVRK